MAYENSDKTGESSARVMTLNAQKKNAGSPCPGGTRMNKITHDFRSSLNIIIGYSELMRDGALGDVTREQSEALKDILASSLHLLELVNDLQCQPGKTRE